jgi:hypothetical protein
VPAEDPIVQALAADPEPTAIAGPGDEAVHGDGDPCEHLAHRLSPLPSQAAGVGVMYQADGRHGPKSSLGLDISMD